MKKKANTVNFDELMKYKKMIDEIPDVRQDKVDEIKKKIKANEYKIDAEATAKKILELAKEINGITKK
ncbi:TPA: flagellar biosynthesis anti-sigma factor FlgM [bacterium]|nr:flagellar biosynthesis anti-sigma factor FlgM [bacterium]